MLFSFCYATINEQTLKTGLVLVSHLYILFAYTQVWICDFSTPEFFTLALFLGCVDSVIGNCHQEGFVMLIAFFHVQNVCQLPWQLHSILA